MSNLNIPQNPFNGGYPNRIVNGSNYGDLPPTYIKNLNQFNLNVHSFFKSYLTFLTHTQGSVEENKLLLNKDIQRLLCDLGKLTKISPNQQKAIETIRILAKLYREYAKDHPLPSISLPSWSSTIAPSNVLVKHLPSDLWKYIFSFLPFLEWHQAEELAISCKAFYQIMNDPAFLKQILNKHSINLISTLYSSKKLQRIILLTGLSFKKIFNGPALHDIDLKFIGNHGQLIESIQFQESDKFSSEGLAYLLQRCPHLHTIEFHNCSSNNFDEYIATIVLFASHLKHLKIIDCEYMSDKALFALSQNIQLQSFIYASQKIPALLTDYGMLAFLTNCTELRTLKLMGCPKITYLSISAFISIKNLNEVINGYLLEEFAFSYCGVTDGELLARIAQDCPNLKSIELDFDREQDEIISRAADLFIDIFQNCRQLQAIKISNCQGLTQAIAKVALSNQKDKLTHFEIYQCSFDFEDSFFTYLIECEKLKCFGFKARPHSLAITTRQDEINFFSDKGIMTLTAGCPHLEILTLLNCPSISSLSLVPLLQSKPNLKSLNIKKCSFINIDLLLRELGQSCHLIENIHVYLSLTEGAADLFKNFNDQTMDALAKGCPSLKNLHLSFSLPPNTFHIPLLSTQTLIHLSNCSQLQTLTLSCLSFSCVSNEMIAAIFNQFYRSCPHLTYLTFMHANFRDNQQKTSIIFKTPRHVKMLSI